MIAAVAETKASVWFWGFVKPMFEKSYLMAGKLNVSRPLFCQDANWPGFESAG
jgi:predicted component of type VI protein secretion system